MPPSAVVPLAGVYARMGYRVVLCSTVTGRGIDRLRAELDTLQSGVAEALRALGHDVGDGVVYGTDCPGGA